MAKTINGIGTRNIGQANYVINEATNDEELDTTLWFVVLFLPVLPLKSYRIRQGQWFDRKNIASDGITVGQGYSFSIIRDLPLNWMQIVKTYLMMYGGLGLFLGGLGFLSYLVR